MTDDDLGRRLFDAFDAHARAEVPDDTPLPMPRFATDDTARDSGRRRVLAPLLAAAAVIALVLGVLAVTRSGGGGRVAASPSHSPLAKVTGTPVHIKLLNADGVQVGVGMPVIAYFSKRITDGRALQSATTVSVNGVSERGAWYFERSTAYPRYPYEAHLRLRSFWPADSHVHVGIPARGLSAGRGMSFDDSLTLDFTTGAQHIATVDNNTHRMTLTSDGRVIGTFKVSLGARATPTETGTKVIMAKGAKICMTGPGYHECGIRYTQQLTYTGEYLHAAPWNDRNIARGVDSSNGCTNLSTGDARRLYRALEVGDVVIYGNTGGPQMQLGQGFGDWNVPWPQWRTGGLVRTG